MAESEGSSSTPITAMQDASDQAIVTTVDEVYKSLLPDLRIESVQPFNPVVVHFCPPPWRVLGSGNYATVFYHPACPDQVVKVYAPGRPGLMEEVEVYRRLGHHPAFSQCFYAGENFLVLKRLYGTTLYDCLHKGIPIPNQVIEDIDDALNYARSRGLFPHDVHGRNVMMLNQRGVVVDVSDFLHEEPCKAWYHVKKAYYRLYAPLLRPLRLRYPYFFLDGVRQVYRWYRQLTRQL
jgi:hypothetical protein